VDLLEDSVRTGTEVCAVLLFVFFCLFVFRMFAHAAAPVSAAVLTEVAIRAWVFFLRRIIFDIFYP